MSRQSRLGLRGWRSDRRVTADGAVESEERILLERAVVSHSAEGARELGRRYWAAVERSTFRLVRTRRLGSVTRDGEVDLRVLGRGPALLVLTPDGVTVSDHEVGCRYTIRGGLLARGPQGSLTLSQSRIPTLGLRSVVTDYHPRLAARPGKPTWSRPLYPLVQHRLHVWISHRFFLTLVREARK